jgi:hypothetical protein
MAVKHTYTIICDDVRREDNGKLLILGMYMGTITVPQLPAILPSLTVLSLFEGDRPESWSWKLSIQNLERGKAVAEARGFAEVPQPGPGVMPVKFGAIRFDEAGTYNAVLEIEGQRDPIAVIPFQLSLMPQIGLGQAPHFPRS